MEMQRGKSRKTNQGLNVSSLKLIVINYTRSLSSDYTGSRLHQVSPAPKSQLHRAQNQTAMVML